MIFFTQLSQSYIYNIDGTTIKKHVKTVAERNNYFHNIDKPIEEEDLSIDTQLNYMKVIEEFYGNIVIEIGTFNCRYKIYDDFSELSCDTVIQNSNTYYVEIPNYELIYEYKIDYTINCKDCTTDFIINNINSKLLEHYGSIL
jgi:hypothetical protein